jgi:hypothetical protein
MLSSSSGPMPRSPSTKASWERFVSRWVSWLALMCVAPFPLPQPLHMQLDV